MYLCRTLSYDGAEFQTIECPLPDNITEQYAAAVAVWWRVLTAFKCAAIAFGITVSYDWGK